MADTIADVTVLLLVVLVAAGGLGLDLLLR